MKVVKTVNYIVAEKFNPTIETYDWGSENWYR